MTSDLNMSHEKMFHFVSFPLFGFTLVIKLRNLDFKRHIVGNGVHTAPPFLDQPNPPFLKIVPFLEI